MGEKFEFLAVLPENQRQAIRQQLRRQKYAKGETVFWIGDPGDALYLVDRGRVIIEGLTPTGRTATFAVLGEGSFFGELALVGEDPVRSASAIAIEAGTSLLRLSRADFHDLRTRHTAVNDLLLQVMDRQCRRLSEHLLETLFFGADLRIARRLLALCESYGVNEDRSVIELTQGAIADLAGVSRQEMSKLIHREELEGVFATSRGSLEVTSVATLESWTGNLQDNAE